MREELETTDRAIAESVALGVAAVVNLLGFKKTFILAGIGYIAWKIYG